MVCLRSIMIGGLPALAAAALGGLAIAHPHGPGDDPVDGHDHAGGFVHENGIGPDPDGDTNPATDTRVIAFVGEVLTGADGSAFPVVHFEPPPGRHGEPIRRDYVKDHGVRFGPGLSWQICEGQRHFQYNSMCTYAAPTSGKYAAGYLDYLNRPLIIEFDKPVCLFTLSMYPTGAKENEPFIFTIEGWDENNAPIESASEEFNWNRQTVRWNNIAGAYFLGAPASKIAISMKSRDPAEAKETLRFLIDDLGYISGSCEAGVAEVESRTGIDLQTDVYRLNREENQ